MTQSSKLFSWIGQYRSIRSFFWAGQNLGMGGSINTHFASMGILPLKTVGIGYSFPLFCLQHFRSICIKDQFSAFLPQLMQLSICKVLESIRKFPDVWKQLFQPSQQFQLSADQFLDEAVVEYSTSQLLRDAEVNIYKLFCDVMLLLEEGGKKLLKLLFSSVIVKKTITVPITIHI